MDWCQILHRIFIGVVAEICFLFAIRRSRCSPPLPGTDPKSQAASGTSSSLSRDGHRYNLNEGYQSPDGLQRTAVSLYCAARAPFSYS